MQGQMLEKTFVFKNKQKHNNPFC